MQIEKGLNEDFENFVTGLLITNLSIHFGKDKTESILFASKRRAKNIRQ